MTFQLAGFQQSVVDSCYKAYGNGARCVMPVLPTGAGKTVIMGHIAHEYDGFGVSIAHRSELVGQMSVALAREGLRHDIIAPDSVIRTIVGAHMEEIGRSFHDPRAKWKVSSVDTLVRRDLDRAWRKQVGMAHIDEGHHVLRDNKWGRAFQLFDNAYGLFPTATPERADGKGLGASSDGLVNAMVEGPGMRWLINEGHLTDYRLLAPQVSDLDLEGLEISKTTGDYNAEGLRKRVKASNRIIGDVVHTYLRYAKGLKGITFAVDVEHATQIAAAFNAAGVPAVVVTANTPESERRKHMRALKTGELMQLVNVDLFGEGVDVPAVQVVSMARPTASYGLYAQQFGRALRLLVSPILRAAWHTYSPAQRLAHIAASGKPQAVIIDHVGNVIKHMGPPDRRTQEWSLDARVRNSKPTDGIPLRACGNEMCLEPFERIYPACPQCGWIPPLPANRGRPEFVDGDVVLYTQELMDELFGAIKKIDSSFVAVPHGATPAIAGSLRKLHAANQASQRLLRDAMALVLPPNLDERVAQRRFFLTHGVDTLTAMGLSSAKAEELRQLILQKVTAK